MLGLAPDMVGVNAVMAATAWRDASRLLGMAAVWQLRCSTITYNSAITSATSWVLCCSMMLAMETTAVEPSQISCNSLLDAMKRSAVWERALEMFTALPVLPDIITYSSTMIVLAEGEAWRDAIGLLQALPCQSFQSNEPTSTSGIIALGERWRQSLSLFWRFSFLGPNSSYLMASNPFWWRCLSWFIDLQTRGLRSFSFNAPLASLAIARQWSRGLRLLRFGLEPVSRNLLATAAAEAPEAPSLLAPRLLGELMGAALATLGDGPKKRQALGTWVW